MLSSNEALKHLGLWEKMREELRTKIVNVCNRKIESKGNNVGVSFYAFFANKNHNPELLMEAATWWIQIHKLHHFLNGCFSKFK